MRLPTYRIAVLVVIGVLATACGSASARPAATATNAGANACRFATFAATVRQGPDAGLNINGALILLFPDPTGGVRGVLQQAAGQPALTVVGQSDGRAINLVFDLGGQRLLFGAGTLQQPLRVCQGATGGTLVGPQEGDEGDWRAPGTGTVEISVSVDGNGNVVATNTNQ